MRLPRPKLWHAMALVALCAVALAVYVRKEGKRRSEQYSYQSTAHPLNAQIVGIERDWEQLKARNDHRPADKAKFSQRIEHYKRLANKYRLAAEHPWMTVEPDPPEPK